MKKGFTIVETLVAIAVLMIAIAGPLVVASKGLTAAVYARDQVIASNLAQESMEKIRNIKDNNVANNRDWLTNLTDLNNNSCNGSSVCDASSIDANIYSPCPSNPSIGCLLYYSSSDGYHHNLTSGSATQFYRYYYIKLLTGQNDEAVVTVVVRWNNGTVSNEVSLSSELSNKTR